VGAAINWHCRNRFRFTKVQSNFALIDLFAYNLTQNLTLSLNLNNATDEKYLLSPQWGQANYGAPRNLTGVNVKTSSLNSSCPFLFYAPD
jgi:outer-membrane receptor for ferric coprogen and ferric-rhodotorulic acid